MSSNPTPTLTPSQRALLPTSKVDEESVAKLTALESAEIAPLVPELLTWLQDVNWPICSQVRDLLCQQSSLVVDPLRAVLIGDDVEWKANCLLYLVPQMQRDAQEALVPELEKVMHSPTEEEKVEELHDAAAQILESLGLGSNNATTQNRT